MNTKTAKRWAQTRVQGKWGFTLCRGVLAWGLPVGIITGMIRGFNYSTLQISYAHFMTYLLLSMVGGGLVFGLAAWYTAEKEYQAYINGRSNR
uniref:Uncharacterized protein n=1 Tax=Roseihalotalea indica TaxID=2867963 RepID=A0AA49GS06_9BACT|nr:hypothetical protein K4G66_07075 [Tunicatimonas sp. TK19036]